MRKLYLKPTPLLVLPSNPAMRFKTIALVCAAAVAALSGTERLHAANGTSPARGTDHTVAATPLPPGATAIQIDGELNEAIWQKAPIISGFVQRRPAEGAAPSYATEARVVFDNANLYVAIEATDPEPQKIVGHLSRRDTLTASDWLSVYIDSYHDRRTAFEFGVNPAGVKYDRYWFNDSNSDISWDAVWDAAVSRSSKGWRAEFRIPFSQLRFNPASASTFGFAIGRILARADEASTWPLLPRSASGFVSSFGDLTGLSFSQPLKKFEIAPYLLSEVTTKPTERGNPLSKSPDPSATIGLDMKYAVAPGLTFTGTVNPDFGQVEADPAVVNLSGFETFFPEKRPFFVEGSGTFSFDIDCNDGDCTGLLYSRRIGRAPHRFADAPAGGYASAPANTTILGAGKLTGRMGAFSIGALSAVTSRENATLSVNGVESKSPVEPSTAYSVLRASREFGNQSRIGIMATSTNRSLTDELRFLPKNAFTGGVDFDWRLGKAYSLAGYWAGSSVRGTADAIAEIQQSTVHSFQRPGAESFRYDPTRTSLNGQSGSLSISKIAGQYARFNSNVSYKSPGFEINDLGFLSRADEISQSNWFQLRSDTPNAWRRSININFNQWAGWNYDGDLRYAGGNINSHTTLASNWQFGGGVTYQLRGFADRLTRGGPGGYTNAVRNVWGYLNTDTRKNLQAAVNGSAYSDGKGSKGVNVGPSLSWRPRAGVSLSASLNWDNSTRDSQWVENITSTPLPHYVFGRLSQKTLSLTTRVNYTIRPTLTLEIYAAPFVSAGAYTNFKELVNGRAERYEDRYTPYAYNTNPDFNYRAFRSTSVLRWEYRPGSALFIVWQQGREDFVNDGRFAFGSNVNDLFATPATNTFLVKFSRWLNF